MNPTKGLLICSLLLISLIGISNGRRYAILDPEGKYSISWEVNLADSTIEVEAIVETLGYVGFGLSTTGGMVGADIVIGGVDSTTGEGYFSDRYATQNGMPSIDVQQDWVLLSASENSTHTSIRFTRELESCDDQDVAIQENTLKIIWSYGATDNIAYHGQTRGAYAVNLLDPAMPPIDLEQYPRFETVMDEIMPTDDTTYWCTTHKGPSFNTKNHIVGFRPKIESADALRHTHHFTLYKCKAPEGTDPNEFFAPYIENGGGNCLTSPWDQPIVPSAYCLMFVYAWSIGGRELVFPEELGFPVGEEKDEYFLLEAHLDNPTMREGVRIRTGIETFYTPDLRPIDAGMLVVGQVIGLYQTIPPSDNEFVTVGHCSSACTQNMPKEGISMFNIMLHAHKSGRKMKLRHFRGTKELPWIANDETYDFDYQDNRNLNDIMIMRGDQLALECTYDNTWISPPSPVIGGWSTKDEMCEAFIYYYPRSPIEHCFSRYPETQLFQRFGIQNYTVVPELMTDVLITAPPSLANLTYSQVVNRTTWTAQSRDEFERVTRFDNHLDICWSGISVPPTSGQTVPNTNIRWTERYQNSGRQDKPPVTYPIVDEFYQPIDSCAERKK